MRIVITSGIFPPDVGGPANYVPRIAGELVKRGHHVEVICLADSLDGSGQAFPFAVRRILRSRFKPFRQLQTVLTIRESLDGADLVYVNGLSFEALLATSLAKVPTVHKIVGDYAWERAVRLGWFTDTIDAYQNANKPVRLRLLDWLRTTPLRTAHSIIVPSMFLQRIVAEWQIPYANVKVIYNAVELVETQIDALPPFAGATLLTVCRLVAWKGVDGIITQLPSLPDVRLVVAGDGPSRPELEALATRLGVAERVLFLGNVARPQVASYLAQADAFILNSTYEGLPHVVLEAMEAGTPVVATAAGGTGELVEHGETGMLVLPGDGDALRQAIVTVLGDRDLAHQLIEGATRRLAEGFTHQAMVEQTVRILEDAAKAQA